MCTSIATICRLSFGFETLLLVLVIMKIKYLPIFSIHLLFINVTIANLYGYDRNVVELTQVKFRDFVFNKDYACLIEFYNSFCGACRRYSQTWKTFAQDINAWSDVVKVAGVDCSENDELCREYDIQYFPSIRYFSPYLKDDPEQKQLGIQSTAREINLMKALTVNYLQNETNIPHHWPDLRPIENITAPNDIFTNVSSDVKYAILVFPGPTNLELGYELTLDYHKEKEIIIKQINSTEVANVFGIESESTIHSMGRDLKLEKLPTEVYHNYKTIKKTLEKYFTDHDIIIVLPNNTFDNTTIPRDNLTLSEEETYVLNKVKHMTHIVFQADLEKALKLSLTTEIYKNQELQGESLQALHNYVAVVKK